jgi:hypothetical protein
LFCLWKKKRDTNSVFLTKWTTLLQLAVVYFKLFISFGIFSLNEWSDLMFRSIVIMCLDWSGRRHQSWTFIVSNGNAWNCQYSPSRNCTIFGSRETVEQIFQFILCLVTIFHFLFVFVKRLLWTKLDEELLSLMVCFSFIFFPSLVNNFYSFLS